jgi:hypothetical protein
VSEPEDPPIPRRARYGGAAFLALALLAWLALPFGHPAYAVFIPPLLAGGLVLAWMRLRARRPGRPRQDGRSEEPANTPIEPK